jgi:hypothetical protein
MTGCLLAPFKILGFIFKAIWLLLLWCCTNGIKGFVVGGFFVLVIGFFLGSLHGGGSPAQQTTPTSPNQVPTKVEAPYLVKQNGESFYTLEAKQQGSDYILTPCWTSQDGKWIKFESMRLTKEGGTVTVRKR